MTKKNFLLKSTRPIAKVKEPDSKQNDGGVSRINLKEIEVAHEEEALIVKVPRTYEKSQLSPKRDHWMKAMCEEIDMMN